MWNLIQQILKINNSSKNSGIKSPKSILVRLYSRYQVHIRHNHSWKYHDPIYNITWFGYDPDKLMTNHSPFFKYRIPYRVRFKLWIEKIH